MALALAALGPGHGRAASGFPLEMSVGPAPAPFAADGRQRLGYEIRLTNFIGRPLTLKRVTVLDPAGQQVAAFEGPALARLVQPVGAAAEGGELQLGAGRSVFLVFDLALAPGQAAPARLDHKIALSFQGGPTLVEREVAGPQVQVLPPALQLPRAPLAGPGWVAANGLAAPDHRRSVNLVDGHPFWAQRFAIDWIRIAPDGLALHGDPGRNESYAAEDVPVLAVADAVVASVKDGLPENAGANVDRALPVTLDTIAGNDVILDLGGGRYALYGHLRPGSLLVKPGDRVKAGQVLARLGNSGNSDAPHLHFQVMDANSPLGAEGMAYVLPAFEDAGVADVEALLAGKPWRAKAPPAPRRAEFPRDAAVVNFPGR